MNLNSILVQCPRHSTPHPQHGRRRCPANPDYLCRQRSLSNFPQINRHEPTAILYGKISPLGVTLVVTTTQL